MYLKSWCNSDKFSSTLQLDAILEIRRWPKKLQNNLEATRKLTGSRLEFHTEQNRFWTTHVNRDWGLPPFNMHWSHQICFAKFEFLFFFSYREDLHDNLAKPGRGGGDAPKNGVFAPFWSENGYRLCPFGLESGMIFEETTRVYERICRFKWKMNQKERSMHEFEMAFKKSPCLSPSISSIFPFQRVRIWRTARHTPTGNIPPG